MEDRKKGYIKVILGVIALIACIALVVIGQRKVGLTQLGVQLAGLIGVLALLYVYNRGFNIIKIPNYQSNREETEE